MKVRISKAASKHEKLATAIKSVLPRGLPKQVAKFYASCDGLKVTLGDESATLVGLATMFGGLRKGAFGKHIVVAKKDLEDPSWSDLPFYERFFDEQDDGTDKKSLEQLNLRMRLKLLVSVEGESTDLAIDFYDAASTMYYVDRGHQAYALNDLSFDEFVAWFSKFGARRWYFAFLDKKAAASLNIDLRAELESSLADFPMEQWAPLLARFPKPKAVRTSSVARGAAASGKAVAPDAFPPLTAPPLVIPDDGARRVAFDPSGQRLVVWDGDYKLYVYEVATQQRLWKTAKCEAMALSLDGEVVASLEHVQSSEPADRLVLRSTADGKPLHRAPWKGTVALSSVAGVGGNKVAVVDRDSKLHVIDTPSQNVLSSTGPIKNLRSVSAIGNGPQIAAHVQAYDAGAMMLKGPSEVRLIDAATGAAAATWPGASQAVASTDGATVGLLYLGKGACVRVLDVKSGALVYEYLLRGSKPGNDPTFGCHLAFSPDGTRLVVSECTYDATTKREMSVVSVHDTTQHKMIGRVELGPDPKRPDRKDLTIDAYGVALSVDGILCVATSAFGLRFWRT